MELNELEKRQLFQVEGDCQTKVLNELYLPHAVVVTIWMPEEETFEGMKQTAKYLFDDLRPLERVPEKKDHGKER